MTLLARGTIMTDPGRQRTVNEDWCGSLPAETEDEPSVWVIADGVSHYGTGRDAARLAVETLLSAGWDGPNIEPGQLLETATQRANHLLWSRAQEAEHGKRPYAATIVGAVIHNADVWIVAAGDCRAYLLRGDAIQQLTRDHTVAAEEARQGKVRPEDVARHPGRHVLTRCLGFRATVQPDLFHERLRSGDRLVLCSDGLTRHVDDAEIQRIAATRAPDAATRQLIERANSSGGSDNVTVGIVEIASVAEESRPTGPRPVEAYAAPPPARTPRPVPAAPPAQPPTPTPQGAPVAQAPASDGRQVALLHTLGARIGASPDLAAAQRAVLDGLVELTGAARACVVLCDEQPGALSLAGGHHLAAADVAHDPAGIRDAVARVIRDGQPLLINPPTTRPGVSPASSDELTQPSAVCAPLTVHGGCLGALYADRPGGSRAARYTQDDLALLAAFADLAATALDNTTLRARLDAQTREIGTMRTAEERILRSVSSGIIAVDRDGVITSCNRAAAEMLLVDAAAVVGQPLSTILPPRFMLALGAPFGGAGDDPGVTIQGFEMVGELRGRGFVHFEHRLSPLKDDAGATIGFVLALEDRTFLARLERERREAGQERERIMRIFSGLMSPDVLQEVLRLGGEGSGFSGDRRTLTVMFADIRGFTGISERLPPEDVVQMLNGYLGAAADVILAHKGSIDKFIGDAVMALFGAPAPLENHALQAVRAALAMQKKFAETAAAGGQRASFGIGINTGSGIVGMIGSENVKSYTAIGDVVNVAARLEGEARAGEILITDDTYRLIADEVDVEELGSIYVKGRVTPVAVHKVIRLRR